MNTRYLFFVALMVLAVGCEKTRQPSRQSRPPSSSPSPSIPPKAADGTYGIRGGSYVGCTDREQYKKLIHYGNSKDFEAFARAMSLGRLNGTHTAFKNGERVHLVDATWTGLIRVRRRGETIEYWTASGAIKTK